MSLWTQGAITSDILRFCSAARSFPKIDVEAEIEMIESSKLNALDLNAAVEPSSQI